VAFERANLDDWSWLPTQYDAVLAIFFQFASPDLRDRVLPQMARSLRPGGLLVIEGYGPRQMIHRTGGPGVLENLYTSRLLADHFRDMDVLAWRDADIELSEGSGHVGRSHVVSALLRKPID
jgi:SAM-dependent methyltransferase